MIASIPDPSTGHDQPSLALGARGSEQVMPYARYTFGQHGDISLQIYAKVFDAAGNPLAADRMNSPTVAMGNGVTQI